jgi:hypothetical protein
MILHDPMHILLEGIVKMELQLILSEFIDKKNFLPFETWMWWSKILITLLKSWMIDRK